MWVTVEVIISYCTGSQGTGYYIVLYGFTRYRLLSRTVRVHEAHDLLESWMLQILRDVLIVVIMERE